MSITQKCFNADIWLKMTAESTCAYLHCFEIEKTTLKQFFFNMCCVDVH